MLGDGARHTHNLGLLRPRLRLVVVAGVLATVSAGGIGLGQEDKNVQIDTLSVLDTLYHLSGGGGNGLALIDEVNGGVVLVDTKLPGWGQPVLDAVGQVTDLPVTTIINSHAHPGHAGSNAEYPQAARIIAHERTRHNMSRLELYAGPDAPGLPTTTFVDRFSLLDGPDQIELYYFGPAHTDGDIVVVFPAKGVAYLGDLFPTKGAPVIDTANGGSGVAFPVTLAKAVAEIEGVGRVITGHSPFPSTYAGRGRRERGDRRAWTGWMTWDDLAEYADFNREFLAAVDAAYRAGQTVDEAVATLELPDRYSAYDMEQARANVNAIYNERATQ